MTYDREISSDDIDDLEARLQASETKVEVLAKQLAEVTAKQAEQDKAITDIRLQALIDWASTP